MIKIKKTHQRISQGDIYKDIDYIEYVSEKSGIVEVSSITFPLVIVLTQDCDLAQDHSTRKNIEKISPHDKWLISVLVAPLYNAQHFFSGEHLSELALEMQVIDKNKTPGKMIIQNKNPRYHYISFPEESLIIPSVIDFKHYFSVNIQYLYRLKKSNFVCSVSSLYREDISQRFASFLARIGLPNN
jgi:hypothetical protein